MKMIVDNQVVKLLSNMEYPDLFKQEFTLRWPSLLTYLGEGSLFSSLRPFAPNEPIYEASIATLCANEEKEVVHYLFDRLFAENLQQISSLSQMNASFLLQAIEKLPSTEISALLSSTLNAYEKSFKENGPYTMHDLILYLGWDRICVCMARLFDYQTTNIKFIRNIAVLRECLIESYQHIFLQGRTTPGIYRMLEAFIFYHMREENLNTLSTVEWEVISKGFQLLKSEEELMDCFYIDDAITSKNEENDECYVTLDSKANINDKIALAEYMLEKIKSDFPNWNLAFHPKKIISFE